LAGGEHDDARVGQVLRIRVRVGLRVRVRVRVRLGVVSQVLRVGLG